ncbi:MAG: hypothetical protein H0X24_20650 [Ktedonobacterales bacterium]|nr:hypothetical protein [Ktedonobacterales bacterium]
MSDTLDPIVRTWIALLDSAEVLLRTAGGRDPGAFDRVHIAVDLLLKHEHILTAAQRELARRTVWLRDNPEPLPADTSTWGHCHCPACLLDAQLARARQHYPALLARAVDIALPQPTPTTQGELFA